MQCYGGLHYGYTTLNRTDHNHNPHLSIAHHSL